MFKSIAKVERNKGLKNMKKQESNVLKNMKKLEAIKKGDV